MEDFSKNIILKAMQKNMIHIGSLHHHGGFDRQ